MIPLMSYTYEVTSVVKVTEKVSTTVVTRLWEVEEVGSCSLMGRELQYRLLKKFWRWIVVLGAQQ